VTLLLTMEGGVEWQSCWNVDCCEQLGLVEQNCLQCWMMSGLHLTIQFSYYLAFETAMLHVLAVLMLSEILSFTNSLNHGRLVLTHFTSSHRSYSFHCL